MSELRVINNERDALVVGSGTSHIAFKDLSCYNMIAARILSGSELTICAKKKEAWLDYGRPDRMGVPYDYARVIVECGFVGEESGNYHLGETHYTFLMRPRKTVKHKVVYRGKGRKCEKKF